jgi:hypothetical protein
MKIYVHNILLSLNKRVVDVIADTQNVKTLFLQVPDHAETDFLDITTDARCNGYTAMTRSSGIR